MHINATSILPIFRLSGESPEKTGCKSAHCCVYIGRVTFGLIAVKGLGCRGAGEVRICVRYVVDLAGGLVDQAILRHFEYYDRR